MSRRRIAGCSPLDQKAAHTFGGSRPDNGDVGYGAVGDPSLLAVKDPVIAAFFSGTSHAAGIGAEAGLSKAKTSDGLAGLQLRQPALLLLFRSISVDRDTSPARPARTKLRRPESPRSSLLHDEAVLDVVHPGTTVTFQVRSEETPARPTQGLGAWESRLDCRLREPREALRSSTNWRAVWRTINSCSLNWESIWR